MKAMHSVMAKLHFKILSLLASIRVYKCRNSSQFNSHSSISTNDLTMLETLSRSISSMLSSSFSWSLRQTSRSSSIDYNIKLYLTPQWKIIITPYPMMINAKAATALQNERFRTKLQASCPNYAYEILLLEIIVEDDHYPRKPTIDEISKLIQLYMLAVEVLESAADKRYDYFKRKIHSLMLKKHIVEQMHFATGRTVDQKTLDDCFKADLETRKNEHEAQVYFNKTDNTKVQEILKKAELQVKTLNTNIRKNIMTQEEQLEQRIKNRKMKSESGSVSKFKIESHNAQAKPEEKQPKADPRMDYFQDYGQNANANPKTPTKIGTSKNIRGSYGSVQKIQLKKVREYV